jgi:hypothetical protein
MTGKRQGPSRSEIRTVNVAAPGTYDIKAGTKKITIRGIFQLSVNGTNAGPTEDEYSANGNGVFQEYDLGSVTFPAPGNYSFKFTVIGHNSSSSGYTVCFDLLQADAAISHENGVGRLAKLVSERGPTDTIPPAIRSSTPPEKFTKPPRRAEPRDREWCLRSCTS